MKLETTCDCGTVVTCKATGQTDHLKNDKNTLIEWYAAKCVCSNNVVVGQLKFVFPTPGEMPGRIEV